MPLPLSAVIQQHIQQWHQSAAAVVHLVKSAIALYTSSEYWSQPYHTSKLTGSDFPAWLGLKAGSAAQLLEASGLSNSKPEPVFQASEGLGLSRPANPGFPA